jgi:cytochrome c
MHYRLLDLLLISLMLAGIAAHPVQADVSKGGQLARQWCASCHVIGDSPATVVQQGPPSFRTIAGSGKTAEQLRSFLTHPHGAMPDLSLTRAEIDDLIGYIETLH